MQEQVAALAIPRALEEVNVEWLGAIFETTIESVTVAGATAGCAVTSQVFRLLLVAKPPESAPRSIVVKLPNSQWPEGSQLYKREVHFYREFASGSQLPVPECHYVDYDETTGAFVLILQDVGGLSDGHRLAGLTGEEAEAVFDALSTFHASWWRSPALEALEVRGHDATRIERTLASFERRVDSLVEDGRYPLSDQLLALVPTIKREYTEGMAAISSTPQTLVHADLHLENYFLHRREHEFDLFILDWQNASFGNCAFDACQVLASFRPSATPEERLRLALRYHEGLGKPEYTRERFRSDLVAALHHQFVGSMEWFATTAAQSTRDAAAIQSHWKRLTCAVAAVSSW